jgi:hypothetical protein
MRDGSDVSEVCYRWAELSGQRLAWAHRAHRKLVESLSEPTRAHFVRGDSNGDAYVVVFGRTQVGKTTLLLELMGLGGEHLKRVGMVLRGGRDFGHSATSTTMEYRRNHVNNWRIGIDGEEQELHGDDGMSAALADLRTRMSRRRLDVKNPVVVWIPSSCFATVGSGPQVRILDLPGDSPADQAEQDHVRDMARTYVPNADLVLLVGRGDDLSFLQADALSLPGISDWQFMPRRFRIVTTYSFTPQSVRDQARQQMEKGAADAGFFRRRLIDQLRTFGLKLDVQAASEDIYFPLEFGDSWARAGLQEDGLFQHLQPMISVLKQELHEAIAASTTELSRLHSALDVQHTVNKLRRMRLVPLCQESRRLRRERVGQMAAAQMAAVASKAEQAKAQAAAKTLAALPETKLKGQLRQMTALDCDAWLKKANELDTDAAELSDHIVHFTSDVARCFLAIRPDAESPQFRFWNSLKPGLEEARSTLVKSVEAEFAALQTTLRGYWFDTYLGKTSDSYIRDLGALRTGIKSAAQIASKKAAALWWDAAQAKLNELAATRDAGQGQAAALQLAGQIQRHAACKISAHILCVDADRRALKDQFRQDLESSKRFLDFLKVEYAEELALRQRQLHQETDSVSSLLRLLAASQLIEQHQFVMGRIQ